MSTTAVRSQAMLPVVLTAAILPVVIAGAVLFCFEPSRYHFYPICVFHKSTGLLCAGCGSLRALHQLLHGHWAMAFRFNPLVIGSLPLALWIGGRWVAQKARNQPVSLGFHPAWLWVALAALVAFSVVRNVPGFPFASLPQ